MKQKLLRIFAFFLSIIITAQGNQNYGRFSGDFSLQSPNATPFATYGKYPVNLYKGVPIINIPLFSMQIGENQFDIALNYNVKSVKPETIPTWVGLGWNLNVGGAITRIVNGGVDEVYHNNYQPYNRFSYLDNFSTLDNADWSSNNSLQNYYQNNLSLVLKNLPGAVPNPDEFIINIAGITGSFYMNEKGQWIGRTREGRTFRVEHLYKYDYQLSESVGSLINKTYNLKRILYGFNIIMDDGTKYIFGQDDQNIEFTSTSENIDPVFNPQIVPSAWYIKKIQYRDGKAIKFIYERDNKAIFLINRSGNASFYSQGFGGENISNSKVDGNYYTSFMNKLNQVFLKEIEGEDFLINFTRSLANQKEYNPLDYPYQPWEIIYDGGHHLRSYSTFKHWYKIDKISIKDKSGHLIKNIDFTFNNDPNDRLLLKKIVLSDIEKYDFKYNAQKLPDYLSDAVDSWGYYNGSNFLGSVASFNVNPDQLKNIFQNIYPSHKIPNQTLTKASTLEEITYPTGGKSYFTYESNAYSKFGDKDLNSPKLKLTNSNGSQIAGGLRIQQISSCDENNNCYKKSYSYLNDDGTSSGILPYKPYNFIEGNEPNINLNFWEFNMHSYQTLKDEDNSIGYSKVTVNEDNGGKTETYFTNFDQSENNDKRGESYYGWHQTALFKQLPYTSYSLMRGKPKKEVISTSTTKISETLYTYTQRTDFLKAYSFNSKQFGDAYFNGAFTELEGISYGALIDAHYINFNSSFLTKKETTFNGVSTEENFAYNNDFNTLRSTTRTEGSNLYETEYTYPPYINNSPFTENYMVGVPLTITNKKDGKTLSKTQINYPTSVPDLRTGNLVLPISKLNYRLDNNNNGDLQITYDKYDDKGNVIQYTSKDGVSTVVVYGYNKTKPIAKVTGSTYPGTLPKSTDIPLSLINSIQTSSDDDAEAGPRNSETNFISVLNDFRNAPEMKSYFITTYTYDPVIGVRSITTPEGDTSYYIYDNANRLEKILDQNNNIIKEFKYNYAIITYYNDLQEKTFIRNNCGPDHIGGTYKFIVPAKTYSSLIDKEDANAKALQDINNNGQNAANSYGTCTYMCVMEPYYPNLLDASMISAETTPNHFEVTFNATYLEDVKTPMVIGHINTCAPNTQKIFSKIHNGKTWTLTLEPNGDVRLRASGGILQGESVGFVVQYDK